MELPWGALEVSWLVGSGQDDWPKLHFNNNLSSAVGTACNSSTVDENINMWFFLKDHSCKLTDGGERGKVQVMKHHVVIPTSILNLNGSSLPSFNVSKNDPGSPPCQVYGRFLPNAPFAPVMMTVLPFSSAFDWHTPPTKYQRRNYNANDNSK